MARTGRYYLARMIGTGTDDDPRRPALADALIGTAAGWSMQDAPDGAHALVHVKAESVPHATVAALVGVEDLAGEDELGATLANLSAARRDRLVQRVNTLTGLTLDAVSDRDRTLRSVVRAIGRRRDARFGEDDLKAF